MNNRVMVVCSLVIYRYPFADDEMVLLLKRQEFLFSCLRACKWAKEKEKENVTQGFVCGFWFLSLLQ